MNVLTLIIATFAWAGPPLSPTESLKCIQLADPNLVVELVASEPDIVSPVAMAWDADGRLYVAEMSDYPRDGSGGRIKMLEDRDGDGRYERVTVFADGLPFPNGVLPWNGGILATAAPNIWFFKDTDGDGKADVREVVLTGFGEGNQQLRVNGLYWGLDNWIYGANGRSDGDLRWPNAKETVPLRRRDFRLRPDLKKVEPVAGFSQFGLGHNDWGDRFPSWNTVPWRQVLIEDGPLARLAAIPTSAAIADILDPSDGGRVFGIAPPPERFNRESASYFNATCGTHVFRGPGLGQTYAGDGFVCEPLSNLIHRRKLIPEGSAYRAVRVEAGKEFLATTDSWSHPVFLADGPDGALYVADFYRKWVEHPDFTPENVRKRVDFREGWKHGRIWRIRHRDFKPLPPPRLTRASIAELVAELSSPSGWRRDTAQRLLLERKDRSAIPLLENAAARAEPVTRVQALWTLAGLDSLRDDVVRAALKDSHPDVRRNAVRLAADRPKLSSAVRSLAGDSDPKVQLQTALSLRNDGSDEATSALIKLAASAEDDGRQLAILCAVQDHSAATLLRVWGRSQWTTESNSKIRRLHQLLAVLVGSGGSNEIVDSLLQTTGAAPPWVRVDVVLGLSEGLARTGKPLDERRPSLSEISRALLLRQQRWAKETAGDRSCPIRDREASFLLLATLDPKSAVEQALSIVGSSDALEVQRSAARALGRVADAQGLQKALERWEEAPIAIRRELAWACLGSESGSRALLVGIQKKQVHAVELEPALADSLREHPKQEIRNLAAKALPRAPSNRGSIVAQYRKALDQTGDAKRGEQVFVKNCRTCHIVRGDGNRVGPDLSGVASRAREALLTDILDPNREVSGDYMAVVVAMKNGRSATGILAGETAAHVAIVRADGVSESIPRTELESLRSTGKSLMPEGFERNLSQGDVADLLAFLQRPPK